MQYIRGEVSRNFSGGLRRRTVYLGNFDLKTSVDAETLLGWKGGSAFLYILGYHGKDPSLNVGDGQVTSNIEAPANTVKIYEAWLQQAFLNERASILLGLHDLNSEFYVTETSTMFLNSSFGTGREISQTGLNGPSIFPVTSAAVRVRTDLEKKFYLQAAAFDGVSGAVGKPRGTHVRFDDNDGLLLISEMAYIRGRDKDSKDLYGKYGVGVWSYTKAFDHQSLTNADGSAVKGTSHGLYFLFEQTLFDPLAVFVRYGFAASDVARYRSNLAYGFVATGLIPSRDEDKLGVGITKAKNGPEYISKQLSTGTKVDDAETTLEVSYKLQFARGLALQPDFQWVQRPNTDPNVKDALVGTVRFEVSL